MGNMVKYCNGNVTVMLDLDDGTKIRYCADDEMKPEYPESMDIKITNCCNGINGRVCAWCHERSTPDGKHGDIMNAEFIDKLNPYTELAIGGGNVLLHPDLVPFLEKCKKLKLVPNITVHQKHFMDNVDFLKELCDEKLIYGLGVSLWNVEDADIAHEFIKDISMFPNAVIHVINGIVTNDELHMLSHMGLKILILGYKQFGRGISFYGNCNHEVEYHKKQLYDELPYMIDDNWFDVISFDNLAIEQLNVKRLLDDEAWNMFYCGNDGEQTMYVDLVEKKFAKSSTSIKRYDLMDDIKPMFNVVHNEK